MIPPIYSNSFINPSVNSALIPVIDLGLLNSGERPLVAESSPAVKDEKTIRDKSVKRSQLRMPPLRLMSDLPMLFQLLEHFTAL